MALQIQLRRDDAATWTSVNPILAEGELGIETDTAQAKIGDGVTHWASLAYYGVGLTEPEVQALIDNEAVLREAADATIAGDVTAEATTRASADTALGGRLTTVETALPLKADLVAGTVPDAQIPASIARDSEVTAAIAALVASSPTTLDTLNELAAALGDDPNFATTITTALGGKQPLDSDLTAIAALTTTTFGRGLLTLADAAALRVAAALGSAATAATTDFDAAGAAAAAQAASQPLDSDLTAIAALSTTTFGRSLLALADAAAGRTALGLGSAATVATTAFDAAGAAATEQTRAQAAEALLAPLASPTFTGTLVVPSAKISGKNGLSPRTFTGRSTTTGAPTTGTWAVDDVVRDSAGVDWRCTVAGTPGTWVTDSGSYQPVGGALRGVRAVALGDSITQGATGNSDTAAMGNSWFNRLTHTSGQRLLHVHNAGVAGEDTTQMAARFATDVVAYTPDVCFVLGGTNDIGARGWTAAQAAANLTVLYRACRAAGIEPIAMTIPPRNDGTLQDKTTTLNMWIRRYAAANHMMCLDIYGLLVDPITRNWADNSLTGDGVHPNDKGSEVVARYVWATLASRVPTWVPPLALDASTAVNLLTNGLFTGAAPAGVPTGWNIAPTSLPAATDGLAGVWAEFVTTGNINFTPLTDLTTGFTPGDRLAFSCAYQFDAIGSGNFSCRVYFTSSGGSTGDLGIWQGPKQWTSPSTPGVLNVAYMEGLVPASTAKIRVEIASTLTGATWRVGQVTLANLTTLGLPSLWP